MEASTSTPPEFSLGVIFQYFNDMQFVLLLFAIGSTVLALWSCRETEPAGKRRWISGRKSRGQSRVLPEPSVFTPYYTVPVAMLSLWSLLFASR